MHSCIFIYCWLADSQEFLIRVLNRSLPFFRETFLFHPFCLSLFLSHPELQLIRKSGMVRDAFSTNPEFAERDCYLNSADNQIVINVLRALRAVFPAQGAARQHNTLIISTNCFYGALCEFRVQQIRDGSIYASFK